jgi:hypothetical protein
VYFCILTNGRPTFFRKEPYDFATNSTFAILRLIMTGVMIIVDLTLLIRIFYPFKIPAFSSDYSIIMVTIPLACFGALAYGYFFKRAGGLVAKAYTESEAISIAGLIFAFVMVYAPFILFIVLLSKQPPF